MCLASIPDLLERRYFRLRLAIRHQHTRAQYRLAFKNFGQAIGRVPCLCDLTDENLTAMMQHLLAGGLDPVTVNSRRLRVVAFWNWSARRGDVQRWPTVPRLAEPDRIPEAWSRRDLSKLVAACQAATGRINSAPASTYWLAFHLFAWDTGERTGALLAITWSMLSADCRTARLPGRIRKGGRRDAVYQLRRETGEQLLRLREAQSQSPCGPIGKRRAFGLNRQCNGFYTQYDRLLRAAGLPAGRYNKPQKMRRSFASWIARAGGDPTAALGHSDPRTTRKHYLDPAICGTPAGKILFSIVSKT